MLYKIVAIAMLAACALAAVFAGASDPYVPAAWPQIQAPKTSRLVPASQPNMSSTGVRPAATPTRGVVANSLIVSPEPR